MTEGAAIHSILGEGASLEGLDSKRVASVLALEGAILLRGFDVNYKTFRNFSDLFVVDAFVNRSKSRKAIADDKDIVSVTHGNHPIDLHFEHASHPGRPDLCWFWCDSPPRHAGETIVCDGAKLFSALSADQKGQLRGRSLRFRRVVSPEVWCRAVGSSSVADLAAYIAKQKDSASWSISGDQLQMDHLVPVVSWDPALEQEVLSANVVLRRREHGLQVTWDNGDLVSEELSESVRGIAEALTVEIKWQEGDVAILNNHRFLHGRRKIKGEERQIICRFGNMGPIFSLTCPRVGLVPDSP